MKVRGDDNFLEDIEEKLAGEPVEAIVIGDHGGDSWDAADENRDGWLDSNEERFIPLEKRHVQMSWEDAKPLLDYKYDSGYGSVDCHAVWIWTPTRVLYVGSYDGATWIGALPRHPVDGEPDTA